ncbi:MAG: CsbD family protein [Chloroflexota bacterium]|nr:CsbD family protein [Chloroflexota bacterium]
MSTDILEAKWMQLRGKVKEQWARITDYDLDRIGGKREQLVGLIQEKYGYTKEKAHQEVEQFLKRMNIH